MATADPHGSIGGNTKAYHVIAKQQLTEIIFPLDNLPDSELPVSTVHCVIIPGVALIGYDLGAKRVAFYDASEFSPSPVEIREWEIKGTAREVSIDEITLRQIQEMLPVLTDLVKSHKAISYKEEDHPLYDGVKLLVDRLMPKSS